MAFLRFNRDKRGYEHFYLVEPITNRRGRVRARVLYWFRTPPNVKVGREPFDLAARQALEAQNPQFAFDWRKIIETPIPSADSERWRERRRAERAARHAAPSQQVDGAPSEADQGEAAEITAHAETTETAEIAQAAETTEIEAPETEATEIKAADGDDRDAVALTTAGLANPGLGSPISDADRPHKRRRRRRRGRRGRPPGFAQAPHAAGSPGDDSPRGPGSGGGEAPPPPRPSDSGVGSVNPESGDSRKADVPLGSERKWSPEGE